VSAAALGAASLLLMPDAALAQYARVGFISEPALPEAAKQPVSTAPLAPGEVLLEIAAEGRASAPGDRAIFNLVLVGRGSTVAQARAGLERQRTQLAAALRPLGIMQNDVGAPDPVSPARFGFVGNERVVESMAAMQAGEKFRQEPVQVTVRDVAAAARVQSALEDAGFEPSGPNYQLSDDAAIARRARAAALVEARARAEQYAEAAGMRIVRILRISERPDVSPFGSEGLTLVRTMMQQSSSSTRAVERTSNLAVDFAIAPR